MHCRWACKFVWALWEIVWSFLKKLKLELPYDLVTPLLDIYPKNTKTLIRKDIRILSFFAVLFTIAKIWKQPKWPPIDNWIKKKLYIYAMEYYSVIKKMKSYHLG